MQEILDQILDHVRGAWRFRRYAMITAWIVAILGWAFVLMLPDVYQANSRVFVDARTALRPVLQGLTLEEDVNAQLNLVRQSLLSGPQMQEVTEQVGLVDARRMSSQEIAHVVDDVRDRVTLMVTRATPQSENPDRDVGSIYSIEYIDVSRERALKIVEVLQSRLIENTLGGKREGSENAQKFLTDQIRELEQRLRQAEDRLAAFKKQNVGLMPDEQGGYFTRLQTEMDTVKKVQSSLAVATSRREELQRQLRGEAPIAASSSSFAIPGVPGATGGGGDTTSRIKETQARLDDLLLRFTDKHPDVIAARETLEQLKQRRAAEIEALRRGDPNAAAASGASANPVYQSIQLQLNQADVEIAQLRRELTDRRAKVSELRQSLDTMPQVEAEYARLNRDYDVTRTNYTALVERLEKSRLGEQATSSGSVRFDVIEPPNAAFSPVSPKRPLLIAAVFGAAIVAGAALAFLFHQLKPVFSSARALAAATGLEVLGAISMTWVDRQDALRKKAYLRYSVGLAGLFVAAIVVLQLSRMGIRLRSSPGA